MRLVYGSTTVHAIDEAAVSIRRDAIYNDAGVAYAYLETWTIQGFVKGDTQAEISTAVSNLEDSYNRPNLDIFLLLNDDDTVSAHKILARNTVGGIRIRVAPSYPQGEGAEYSTFRNYLITVEAEVLTSQVGSAIVSYDEVITLQGGGPRQIMLTTLNTLPVIQTLSNHTPCLIQQSGRILGLFQQPPPNPPIFTPGPNLIHVQQPEYGFRSPRRGGIALSRMREFEVTWRYVMASRVPCRPVDMRRYPRPINLVK